MTDDDTQNIVFPEQTKASPRTTVRINHMTDVQLAEGDVIRAVIHERRTARGAEPREIVARIVGLRLHYVWRGERDRWEFSQYDSHVTVQRTTLNGWGKPVSRVLMDFQAETRDLVKAHTPAERPEVSWHA